MEGSIAPTEQDDIVEDKIETEKEVEEAPVASSSKLEEPVMEEVVEEAIVHPAPSTPGGTDLTLPTTNSLLILLSHRVLMSPDVRFDMEEGLAERAEMIKLQGREVRAFVEGRGKKRLKLEAEMAVALGAAAKGEKLAEVRSPFPLTSLLSASCPLSLTFLLFSVPFRSDRRPPSRGLP